MNDHESKAQKSKKWIILIVSLGVLLLIGVAIIYVVKSEQKTSIADQDTLILNRDLKTFCEKMASGEFRSGAGGSGGMGGGVRFQQIQELMAEMQSLCWDDVYTHEEIVLFNELQSQMPAKRTTESLSL